MSYYINHKFAWWLKEHGGFDEWCSQSYDRKGNLIHANSGGKNCVHNKDHCSAPTHSVVKDWLKLKGYYYLAIEPQGDVWRWILYNLRTNQIDDMNISGNGLWECESKGVERALELLTGIKPTTDIPKEKYRGGIERKLQLKFELARMIKMIETVSGEINRMRKYWEEREGKEEELRVILENMITGEEFLQASRDILDDTTNLCN